MTTEPREPQIRLIHRVPNAPRVPDDDGGMTLLAALFIFAFGVLVGGSLVTAWMAL